MPFCNHCGKEYDEGAVICTACGFSVKTETVQQTAKPCENSSLLTVAKVFMILGCVLNAFFYLIPLAWCIPMTVSLNRKMSNNEPIGVGFKVCSLLFVSLVGGILLLCHKEKYEWLNKLNSLEK